MQWPPRPGPGSKRMKPNGFVAAASTTSQMSIPIRSQSCASSLTSAMLTERKMFSSSFVSSAASGVETRWTLSIALPYSAAAASVDASLIPPTTFGTVFVVWSMRPGSTRSGENARWKSTPAVSPEPRFEDRQDLVAGRARVRRRLEHDEVALAEPRRDLLGRRAHDREVGLALLRERRRQRDQDRVGLAQLVVVGRRAQAALVDELLQLLARDVLDVALAAVQLRDALGADVDEQHRAPGVGEDLGERHADVAGADDCDVTMHSGAIVPPSTAAIRSEAWPSP